MLQTNRGLWLRKACFPICTVIGDDVRHYEIAHETVFNQLGYTYTFANSRKICIYTVIF